MRKDIISNLLTEPHAHLLIDEVYEALGREQERRISFRNENDGQEKVEFINGEVIIHSPVKKRHNQASLLLAQLLNIYSANHSLGFVGIEKIMITLTRNDYEPDICFFKNEKSVHFTEDQILFPAPDLVIEILSDSTEDRDRGVKFKDYQAHKIEEYWIIDPEKQTLEQYHLEGAEYTLVLKSSEEFVKSFVIDGFQIPIRAIFDETENLKAICGF